MIALLVTFLAALLCPSVHSQKWCYHKPECNFTTWPKMYPQFCNGSSQSPINIVTASVQEDPNLTSFTFSGFNDISNTTFIMNVADSVMVFLDPNKMSVKGGGLPGLYNTALLSFHWGNGSSSPGSEHTVNGKQYPMELQMFTIHSKYNGSFSAALAADDSTALAVFAFFIEGTSVQSNKSWDTVSSSLKLISNSGNATVINNITVGGLLEGVDMNKYYRYQGSLTAPNCKENVIWTVFKDPIKISQDLINLFSTTLYFQGESGSAQTLMTNNFRGVQPLNGRVVTSQVLKSTSPSSAATSTLSIITVLLLSSLF